MSIKRCAKPAFSKVFGGSISLKALTAAVLVALSLGGASYAVEAPAVLGDEGTTEFLQAKPLNTPTLDYLNANNVQIPQKDGTPIMSPKSAYKIVTGRADDYSFVYKTVDENGNITDSYYKIELNPEFSNLSGSLGTSQNIHWQKVSSSGSNTVAVKLPNGTTEYYQYTYTAPSGYDTTTYSGQTNDLGTIENPSGTSDAHSIYGGEILNNPSGTTTSLEGYLFKDNKTSATFNSTTDGAKYADLLGGAIYNAGEITRITSDFVGNGLELTVNRTSGSMYGYAMGGAIANVGTIGNITGDFINNSVNTQRLTTYPCNDYAYGGAIYNSSTIGNITGDFIGNYSKSKYDAKGGAIYNYKGTIGDITGDFIGNYARGSSYHLGGAIYNWKGTIEDITGDFIGNYAQGSSNAEGGAIYNYNGTIGDITGDFIGNYAQVGGAICNLDGTIEDITGDFIGNYALSTSDYAYGGAIYNHAYSAGTATIGDITGDFIGNYAQGYSSAAGGAIYNSSGTIEDITGDFINNSVNTRRLTTTSFYDFAGGGAIYNSSGTIGDITGDFIGNYVLTTSSYVDGGAIYNHGTIEDITGDFISNYAQSTYYSVYGGAIYNGGTIGNITGDFISNYAQSTSSNAQGGAIYNSSTIWNITGDFIGNYAKSTSRNAQGGAISNERGTIGNITGDFIGNYAQSTSRDANGGAIYNSWGTIGNITGDFIGNYAQSTSSNAKGGAIWTNADLTIKADNGTSTFKDNYVQVGSGEKDYQAIWVDGATTQLNLQQFNDGKMYMYDNINGSDGYTVNIQGDGTGTYYMLNDIKNANVIFNNTTVNTENNNIHDYHFNSFTLAGDTNFVADVDLQNEQMDRITADSYGEHTGKLTVTGMNLLSDATKDNTKILFADEGLANNVDTTVTEVAYSPIYKYAVSYSKDTEDNKGYFLFARSSSGSSGDYNPAVIASPVATQSGAMATMQNTFNYSFISSDSIMNMPSVQRVAMINRNKYAIEESSLAEGTNPLYQPIDTSTVWFKPYASFENIPLKNGPAVKTISYGTLVGYDTDLKELKKGWVRNWTGYVGYNGASMSYSNVDTYQNGGLLGGTLSLYKGKFFNATTISAGAIVGESHTMYGHENNTSLLAGIGNKTGYNIEFKGGRYIIQPNIFIGYTFVKTFDFKNAAGVNIDSKPFNNLQLSPGVKFIMNTKTGWQPYIGVNMVWNVLNKSDVTANGVHLPSMSIRPYVQYGIGIQKTLKDNFTAYTQAMIQNGGRNGVSLTAGLRWALGKDGKHIEKVQSEQAKTLVTKQVDAQVEHKKVNLLHIGKKTSKNADVKDLSNNTVDANNLTTQKANTQETKAQKVTALKAKLQIGSDQHGGAKHVLKEAKKPLNHKISTLEED